MAYRFESGHRHRKSTPKGCFFYANDKDANPWDADVRWTSAGCRLDGIRTIMFSSPVTAPQGGAFSRGNIIFLDLPEKKPHNKGYIFEAEGLLA